MASLDWIFAVVLLASMAIGAWRGLVFEVLSVAGWVASFFVAQWFAPDMAAVLPLGDSDGALRYAAGFIVVFVGAVFACGFLAWLAKKLVDAIGLRPADRTLGAVFGVLRGVVVASGLLSNVAGIAPEKSWRALDATTLATLFAVNSIGPALLAKHLLPLLPRHGRAIFAALSARVGSIEDNRRGGWYGYRASKAALNMLLKSLALELTRRAPAALCVGLHPGTVDTALSKPFQSAVPEQQLFTPAQSALCLLEVLDGLQDSDTGGVFAWDGSRVPA